MALLLHAENLYKTYPQHSLSAVNGISLHLAKGEVLALTGESGSGKTTLLRLLAGLEDLDSGGIRLRGKPVTGPSQNLVPGHPDIRLVHQHFKLFPNISVAENIRYALRKYDTAYREQRLTQMLHLGRLERVKHQIPKTLSDGEQQRTALATALADEPLLLLMDEPFSNLDVVLKGHIKEEVMDFVRSSRTSVIFVTHDPQDALSLADRIILLREGKIIQDGSPSKLYGQPASPYVARFFGAVTLIKTKEILRAVSASLSPTSSFLALLHTLDPNQLVGIRPEDVIVQARQGELTGKVTGLTYYGAYEEAIIQVSRTVTVRARIPAGSVPKGEAVNLTIHPGKVIVFK